MTPYKATTIASKVPGDEGKMDAKTLEALKGSIAKWEKIVAGTGADEGEDNCPLCALFSLRNGYCRGCPVESTAKAPACVGTPYGDWWAAAKPFSASGDFPFRLPPPHTKGRAAVKRAAQAELDFLKSLLPEGA